MFANTQSNFMASYNQTTLMGNLTRDPETKYTQSGKAICKLGLALNEEWKDKEGQKHERVTFVDVDVFGRTAENCAQYLRKGRPVFIVGKLKMDQWQDKNTGQNRSKLGVIADKVQFLGGQSDAPASTGTQSETQAGPVDDDQVPF